MKRFSILVLLILVFNYTVFAQEPGNNLRKTLEHIQQRFPNTFYLREDKRGYNVYKSNGEDRDFTCFYFKNGLLNHLSY